MGWWIADWWKQPNGQVIVISWVFWVIGSIILHELSHGWAAIRAGDRTPIYSGHMTWNPLVHMGHMSLITFALFGIAWGAMPVNPSAFRGRYDDAKVAGAGPAMNLAIAIVCLLIAAVWRAFGGFGVPDHVFTNVMIFFTLGTALNIGLMLFNLIPIPPLDGSKIVATFVPSYRRLMDHPHAPIVALIVFLLLFQSVGGKIFSVGFRVTGELVYRLATAIQPGSP
jgi:Zn-dependent protease